MDQGGTGGSPRDAVVHVPRRATKSAGLPLLIAAAGVLGGGLPFGGGGYAPPKPREITDADRARIARAELKRARKNAARRQENVARAAEGGSE